MANPKAEVEISAHSRNLAAKLREARAKFSNFGAELKKNVFGKDIAGGGHKAAAAVVGGIASTASSAALGFIVDQARATVDFNDKLTRLQITAEATPEAMQAFSASVRQASDATGLSKASILDAGASYVALTGDMATAQSQIGNWAKVAQATNSSIQDISATAAALKQNMKIDPGDTLDAFGILAVQGKKGAIELKDLASQMANIAPQWAMFKGGSGLAGLKQMGAALQIAKRGFGGDASETVTGVQGMLTAFVKNSKRFHEAGVEIFEKDPKTGIKHMRGVFDILDDISKSKLIKDPAKMEKAFGRVEAYRTYLQLGQNRDEMHGLSEDAGNAATIQKDLDTYLQSNAGKTTQAFEQAKNVIMEAFTPGRIETFTGAIVKLIGVLATAVSTMGALTDLGRHLGGGDTQEEQQKKALANRREERLGILRKQIVTENPGLAGEDMADAVDKRAHFRMANEDAMRETIAAGKRFGGARYVPEVRMPTLNRDRDGGFYANSKVLVPGHKIEGDDPYSIAELVALKKQARGTSDEGRTQQVINEAIGKAVGDQIKVMTDRLVAALKEGKPVQVKIDSATVAEANRKAASHRWRPAP